MGEALQLYVLVHRPGPKWLVGAAYGDQPGVLEHFRFLTRLREEGTLIMAGPFLDDSGGMAVIRSASEEAAGELAASDPAVVSGLLMAEVRSWRVPLHPF